jgi:RimJ/RimL family protein N-acetyltransferase
VPSLRFRGEKVVVRPLRRADAELLARLLRDRRVVRFVPLRVRRETGAGFVDRVLGEQHRGEGFAFAIEESTSKEVVGQIRLFNWSRYNRDAEVGYWLLRSRWGRGLATEAVRLVCAFGFPSLRLHRIQAFAAVGNTRSDRLLRRLGFRCEGRSRQSFRSARGWGDERSYGLLRAEFLRRARRR